MQWNIGAVCILILKWKSSVLRSDWINGRLNDSCMLRRGGLWANEEPLYLLCDAFGCVAVSRTNKQEARIFLRLLFLFEEVVLLLDDSTPT